jgi:DNA-binding CsgD family transcriptional regulator
VLGTVRARRGDGDPWAPLDEALPYAQMSGHVSWIAPIAAARAEAAWLEGRHDVVRDETQSALDLARDRRASWEIGELVLWRRRAGVDEEVHTKTAEPYALQLAGKWSRAAQLWSELGCPYEAALARTDADDPDVLRAALAELHSLDARPAAAIVARSLRARGIRDLPRGPRPSTRRNIASLTSRELEVLRLVAEGLTNAEIAERLFLSPKTVDHHVSAILRKLDVHSRGHAVTTAMRLGLSSAPQTM